VLYELHVGTFSSEGTYAGAEQKLSYLVVSSFSGTRNWGYDGVLPYAPTANYGRPEDLKHFIDAAHSKHVMVFLDVVYNHFGPEGNYLNSYAPQFFTERHHTPWGQAINFDGPDSRTVRAYFIRNAVYWLEEYRFDDLRFNAVHAIFDDSNPDFLTELASSPGEQRLAFMRDLMQNMHDGRVKMYVIWRALELRNCNAELFREGEYVPLQVSGEHARHIVAFARRNETRSVIVAVPRLTAKLLKNEERLPCSSELWKDTSVQLPAATANSWHNVLTGA
jgi:maltooligosyltrehalose synthase